MHPNERPSAHPGDAGSRVMSNVPRSTGPAPGGGPPPPGRSQTRVATRRIIYAAVIAVGFLLLMIGGDFFIPQVAVLGVLILIGVPVTLLPGRLRIRARQLRRLAARFRGLTSPSATRYVPSPATARPVTQPSPSPRVYTDPMSHDAVIRGTHRATFPTDGDQPQS